MITQESLKHDYNYDPTTGIFTWARKRWRCRANIGDIAGDLNGGRPPHWRIKIDGIAYMRARLAWLYCYGVMPENVVLHVNGNGLDDRIENLKDCSKMKTLQQRRKPNITNKVQILGVSKLTRNKKIIYEASIRRNGKQFGLGYFDTAEDAEKCYLKFKKDILNE